MPVRTYEELYMNAESPLNLAREWALLLPWSIVYHTKSRVYNPALCNIGAGKAGISIGGMKPAGNRRTSTANMMYHRTRTAAQHQEVA
jgi:hypothetical protein